MTLDQKVEGCQHTGGTGSHHGTMFAGLQGFGRYPGRRVGRQVADITLKRPDGHSLTFDGFTMTVAFTLGRAQAPENGRKREFPFHHLESLFFTAA